MSRLASPQEDTGERAHCARPTQFGRKLTASESQRHIAAELGIALGLVNAYLKRCIKKGWVKVNQAPARRYAYYLTPQGFTEKSRLTVDYLSSSFPFFRRAKADCADVFAAREGTGFQTRRADRKVRPR